MSNITNISQVVNSATKVAERAFRKQLRKRRDGSTKRMNYSNQLSASIKGEMKNYSLGRFMLTISGLAYGAMMDKGISNIPYTQGSGVKGESQYIKALALWCQTKFRLNKRNALLMAFRVARKRKYEQGVAPHNPGWIKEIKEDVDKELINEFSTKITNAINLDVFKALNKKINY